MAALLKIRVEMGLHRDSGDDLAVHAGQLLAERNVARADLARVTAERDRYKDEHGQACLLVAKMHHAATGSHDGPTLGVVEDVAALAAKLARAEGALDFAARTLRGEGCEDQGQAYDMAQRAIDAYSAEQEPTDSPPFCRRHDCPLPCPACGALEPRTGASRAAPLEQFTLVKAMLE